MDTPYAFLTLVTSDQYLPGALAVAAALKDLHPSPPSPPEVPFQTLCLVTPESVDVSSIKLLRRAFDVVIGVEIIEQEDLKGLHLLGRPDLNLVLTKLHMFRLTQYSKIIFLDADVLPVRSMSHLFTIPHEFAAVPDVGWPDIFNSGVMVFSPGEDKFNEVIELLKSKGSWDGGDQGILNEWRGNDWHRLSFTYNTTPTAVYTYAPAYERFGSQISAIHFIGPNKPWVSVTYRPPGVKFGQASTKSLDAKAPSYDYESLVDRWFDVYDRHYRSEHHPQHANFEFTRYDSVWDLGISGAETGRPSSAVASGAALGLDDLRKIAVQGISSYNTAAHEPPRVGEYRSMPLNGRVDLMRPRKETRSQAEAETGEGDGDHNGDQNLTPKQPFIVLEGGDIPRMETLPTPLPHELPPAPHRPPLSLPPSAPSTPGQPQYFTQHQYHEAPYLSSEGDIGGVQPSIAAPPLGMHWASHGDRRFFSQSVPLHPEESEQSDDQRPGMPTRQSSWKASESHRGQTHVERHHHREHHRGTHSPNHHRNGHQSPRNHGVQSPRGYQSPRGVHSPRGHHSPQHRRPPPPGPPHASEQPYHPHPHYVHQQVQHSPERSSQTSHDTQSPVVKQIVPFRPSSPPKFEWNPAIEPPPKTPPPPSAFPTDTYFPNIWDQAPSREHDATYQYFPSQPSGSKSETFFQPPPPSRIPEQLLREGQYESVIGRAPEESSGAPPVAPAPDQTKLHAIFPWEEKPRHAPRRVFPTSESLPAIGTFIEVTIPKPPAPMRTALALQQPSRNPPPIGLPLNVAYSNAWDTVPSIQQYASKLVRPHQSVFQPPPPEFDEGWRRWDEERQRAYQEKDDASSMDGDDEDEGDDDERSGNEDGPERAQRRRPRAGSSASPVTGKAKKYRGRGVQTVPVETRSLGVQVSVWAEDVEAAQAEMESTTGPDIGASKSWPQLSTGIGLLPPVSFKVDPDHMAVGTPTVAQSSMPTLPFPAKGISPGIRSPQTLGSPRTYSPPTVQSPKGTHSPPHKMATPRAVSFSKAPPLRGPPSPRNTMSPRRLSGAQIPTSKLAGSPQTPASPALGLSASSSPHQSPKLTKLSYPFSPPLHRMSSNDTMATSSPSTTGPLETPEGTPLLGPARPSGRVWDPARGVDVFKRSSEEVLARFLRSGSFERTASFDDEDGQRRPG